MLYLEPAATLDIDISVTLPTMPGSRLVSLAPIYDYLKARGCVEEEDHMVIAGWPVQFLPPSDQLECKAVAESVQTEVDGVPTWIRSAEHLVAIALRTGRVKDRTRILQFFDQKAVDQKTLQRILERFGLAHVWQQFEERYLGGTHG